MTPDLRAALAALATAPRLLVALDFDGTLGEHVDDPELARALPANTDAVVRLAATPGTTVAIVSGRPLEFLSATAALPEGLLLVGSHGAELSEGLALDADELRRRAHLIEELEQVAAPVEGAFVERKPAGAALHTRLTPPAAALAAQHEARLAADRVGGLFERDGKNVLEFALRSDTKGDALERLRERVRPDAVLYAGDDVTDEDAFAVLRDGDLALKVGEGATAAAHRIPGPADLAAVLDALAGARAQHGAAPLP